MDLFSLVARLTLDRSDYEQGIDKSLKSGKKLSSKLGNAFKNIKKASALMGAGVLAGGAALVGMAKKAASAADHIDKMSQKIGISREAYQELDFVMSQSGTSVDNLQIGIKTLTAKMDAFAAGNKDATATFEKLGVTVKNSDGTFRSQEDVFFDTVAALQGVEDQTEKSRLATELFGKSGLELMPLLNGAAGSMDEMRKQAHDLGLVMSDESIDAGVKLTDTIDQVKRAFSAIVTQIGVSVMPMVQTAFDWVIAHMPEIREFVNNAFEAIGTVINTIVDIVKDYLVPAFDSIVKFVSETLVPVITDAWTNTIQPAVVGTFEAISNFWTETLQPVFEAIKSWLEEKLGPAFDVVTGAINGDKESMDKLADAFNKFLPILAGAIGAFISYKAAITIGKIIDIVTHSTGLLSAAQAVLNAVMNANPFVVIATLLGGLATALITAYNTNEDFRKKVDAAWKTIKTLAEVVWGKVVGWFSKLGDTIKDVWDDYLRPVADWFSRTFTPIIDGVKDAFNGIVTFLTDVFTGNWESAWNTIVDGFGAIFGGIGDLMKEPINAVIDAINWMIGAVESAINGVIEGINKHVRIKIAPISVFGQEVFHGLDWGANLKKVSWGRIEKLATGGYLDEGQRAIVGERRPEMLSVVNGHALVTPIGGIQPGDRLDGGSITNNFQIYQQPGEDANALAERVIRIMTRQQKQRNNAYA